MFGIGFPEMIIIAGIALVVIGPEKFPDFAKIVMRTIRDVRGYVDEARQEINKELKPIKKEMDKLSRIDTEEYLEKLIPSDSDDEDEKDEDEKGEGLSDVAAPSPDYGGAELYTDEESESPGEADDASETASGEREGAPNTIEYASEERESAGGEESAERQDD